MATPLSLRVARILLFLAGGLVLGLVVYIGAASQDPVGAIGWLALVALNALGFFGAWWLLPRDPHRGKILAVGSAIGMGGLGVITGFGAGMLSFPAAAIGALAAWAALLHPPTRRVAIAFVAYLLIGVTLTLATAGPGIASIFTLLFLFVWPIRLLLFPAASVVTIYLVLGLAASVILLAFARRRADGRPMSMRAWIAAAVISLIAALAAVALFVAYANARPGTSARFELIDPLVLGLAFVGAALATLGVVALRLGRPPGAVALGLGAIALFMTFGARPAVECRLNGTSQGVPLAWSLRAVVEPGAGNMVSSGSSGSGGPGGQRSTSRGEIRSGSRVARYTCEGDRLTDWREESP